MRELNVVIVGVGGQGTLLASRILGALAKIEGKDVKVSEVHGMSQRGGSVITHVRIGDDIASPLVDLGGADYVLAFERLEALRALPYLKKGGSVIANGQMISPMPVITRAAQYPVDALETLAKECNLIAMDAHALAVKSGEARAVNLVLLGALSVLTDAKKQDWIRAIESCVPARLLEVNVRAFEAGVSQMTKE